MSRESKPPSKYADCITGDNLEEFLNDSDVNNNMNNLEYRYPIAHHQIDGKTNNVTFSTSPDRIEQCKNAIIQLFGKEKTTLMKDNSVFL